MSDYLTKNQLQQIDDLVKAEERADVDIKEEPDECLQCQECGKQFAGLRDLKRHTARAHDKRSYICNDCGATVEGRDKFCDHKRLHQVVTCDHCSKTVQKSKFARHLAACEGKDKGGHQCDQCGFQTQRYFLATSLFLVICY